MYMCVYAHVRACTCACYSRGLTPSEGREFTSSKVSAGDSSSIVGHGEASPMNASSLMRSVNSRGGSKVSALDRSLRDDDADISNLGDMDGIFNSVHSIDRSPTSGTMRDVGSRSNMDLFESIGEDATPASGDQGASLRGQPLNGMPTAKVNAPLGSILASFCLGVKSIICIQIHGVCTAACQNPAADAWVDGVRCAYKKQATAQASNKLPCLETRCAMW